MIKQTMKRAALIAIAGAVALGAATPLWAAPVSSSMSAVENAAPSMVTDVRNRGHRGHRGNRVRNHGVNGAGVAFGILGAAAAVAGAAAYGQQDYYGGPGYYRQNNPGYYPQGGYYQQDYNGSDQY